MKTKNYEQEFLELQKENERLQEENERLQEELSDYTTKDQKDRLNHLKQITDLNNKIKELTNTQWETQNQYKQKIEKQDNIIKTQIDNLNKILNAYQNLISILKSTIDIHSDFFEQITININDILK